MNLQEVPISDSLGVCVKDKAGTVLFQNPVCVSKCGMKTGTVCGGACMRKQAEAHRVDGFSYFPKLALDNGVADAVLFNDSQQILTLLYPLEEKHRQKMDYYRQRNLTKGEWAVVSLLMEGLSNSEIATRLFISKGTLKTHINNIYKKIPADMRPRA